jgi:ABC-type bacteriocin/lantibiotic exporter with double-glycine peptidase domain
MLLAALGWSLDEATLAQKCGLTSQGCTVQDLRRGARSLGLNAELLRVSGEAAALAVLSNQAPFVAMINLASWYDTMLLFRWHFVVPLAVANDEVTFHDPADGPDRRVTLDDFLAAWAMAGYRGVRVWTP